MYKYASKSKTQSENSSTNYVPRPANPASLPHSAIQMQLMPNRGRNELQPLTISRKEEQNTPEAPSFKPNNTGIPLQMKERFENFSGLSFDDVKVHYNSDKPAQLQSLAYTQGNQVHIGPGQEKHLGHELGHVIQQKKGIVSATAYLNGVAVNDDPGFELAADKQVLAAASGKQSEAKGTAVIQRKVTIGGVLTADMHDHIRTLAQVDAANAAMSARFSRLYDHYINDRENRTYADNAGFIRFLRLQLRMAGSAETDAALVRGAPRHAQAWYDNPVTEGVIELSPTDPLYIQIVNAVMANSHEKPYPTDAMHEVVPSSPSPNIEVTRIQMIKNRTQLSEYMEAKQDIEGRAGGANEMHLLSGHGEQIANAIARQGHRPDLGAYSGGMLGKGHGALGRGAYFTDTVNKAVSYSRAANIGQQQKQMPDDGSEHSFLIQDVLLGNALYGNYFPFRHSHHNEMVRPGRGVVAHPMNIRRQEGSATKPVDGHDMATFDSIVTAKTHEPGGGIFNIFDRAINNSFDSNEYLIRNPDQINVKFRVFYRLRSVAAPGPVPQERYPLTDIRDVHAGVTHLPPGWLWTQRPIGNPLGPIPPAVVPPAVVPPAVVPPAVVPPAVVPPAVVPADDPLDALAAMFGD